MKSYFYAFEEYLQLMSMCSVINNSIISVLEVSAAQLKVNMT